MNPIIISDKLYQELVSKIDEIVNSIKKNQQSPSEIFLDNSEFIKLMSISKRLAQNWRDQGLISFSQIGGKIYYRMSDIKELLDENYIKAFNR